MKPLPTHPALRPSLIAALLLAFHVLPWLQWHGDQALLLDLTARRFDLFWLTLWPDDLGVLLGLMAVLAVALALFTHLFGRLWCGHGCPQTLWSTLFSWIETGTRRWLPRTVAPVVRHGLWAGVAAWTGVTFVGLFIPIRELVARGLALQWSGWELFWVLFYAAATWGNAGFLRRQVCQLLCPFARLQPLLVDGHTPRVLYLASRGEPRGPRPRGLGGVVARGRGELDPTTAQDYVFRAAHPLLAGPMPRFAADRLGDCTDCGLCVHACPVGLDVRDGPQADCLSCSACLVACAQTQQQMGFGAPLLCYTAPEILAGHPRRWLRPRTLGLAGLLLALLLLGAWRLGGT